MSTKTKVEVSAEGGVAAVDRALSILGVFSDADKSLSLAELARRTGFYKSTLLRLATSLVRARYLRRLEDGDFALGPALLRLGELYQASFDLEQVVMAALRRLVRETGESAAYYVRDGQDRVCLYRVASTAHRVLHYVTPGTRFPIGTGASGRILRAFSTEDDPDSPDLSAVRTELVTHSLQDRKAETAAVAAPVFAAVNGDSAAGSLSLAGAASRFTPDALAAMKEAIRSEAQRLTEELGGQWPGAWPGTEGSPVTST